MTRLLVIEDEAPLLKTILDSLRFAGYEAIGALDGVVGLELARSHHPDLIISDIRMPAMDGYAVLQALRSDPLTAHLPVVFLTAKAERDEQRYGMSLGADDYITKPFGFDELIDAVEARLERHAPYHELQQQLAAVSRSEQHKSDMMHLAAQDLRNPITSIRIALHMLKRKHEHEVYEAGDTRELDRIAAAAKHMEHISAEIQALERIDATTRSETVQAVNLNELVDTCFRSFEESAAEQGLGFDSDMALLPVVVLGDPLQLSEAIHDLVAFAMRNTAPGDQVTIRLGHEGEQGLLMVEDTGYGIPADRIDHVFDPFFRIETADSQASDSGMGLNIVKHIVERHQGEVFAESVYGQGSALGFFLPALEVLPEEVHASDPHPDKTNPGDVVRLISHIIGL